MAPSRTYQCLTRSKPLTPSTRKGIFLLISVLSRASTGIALSQPRETKELHPSLGKEFNCLVLGAFLVLGPFLVYCDCGTQPPDAEAVILNNHKDRITESCLHSTAIIPRSSTGALEQCSEKLHEPHAGNLLCLEPTPKPVLS